MNRYIVSFKTTVNGKIRKEVYNSNTVEGAIQKFLNTNEYRIEQMLVFIEAKEGK